MSSSRDDSGDASFERGSGTFPIGERGPKVFVPSAMRSGRNRPDAPEERTLRHEDLQELAKLEERASELIALRMRAVHRLRQLLESMAVNGGLSLPSGNINQLAELLMNEAGPLRDALAPFDSGERSEPF